MRQLFRPILSGVRINDRILACLGACAGIGFAIIVCSLLPLESSDYPLIVAPLGASAVLIFAVPSSPMAQPWPVIGGNMISSLVGVITYHLVPDGIVASSVAVGAAILVMSMLRCLHPPGGASALTAVIGSDAIHAAGYQLAIIPIGINSLSLVVFAILFHKMTQHSYPHKPAQVPDTTPSMEDIDAALDEMHESFDISREDLNDLFNRAQVHATKRMNSKPKT